MTEIMVVWLYNNYSVLHTQDNEYVLNLLLEKKLLQSV